MPKYKPPFNLSAAFLLIYKEAFINVLAAKLFILFILKLISNIYYVHVRHMVGISHISLILIIVLKCRWYYIHYTSKKEEIQNNISKVTQTVYYIGGLQL